MLTSLDATLGDRTAVLDRLREVDREPSGIGLQIVRLWEQYCARPEKIVLVGQAPGPTGPPPGRPLVGGRTGERLRDLTGCSLRRYLWNFETLNVLDRYPGRDGEKGDRFPMPEARAAAVALLPRLAGRKIVLVGRKTAEAFGIEGVEFFSWMGYAPEIETLFEFAVVPHPSPVNLFWNDPTNVERAKRFFDELLASRSRA